jgi:ABC-type lipoprotein export system ATPase subunit
VLNSHNASFFFRSQKHNSPLPTWAEASYACGNDYFFEPFEITCVQVTSGVTNMLLLQNVRKTYVEPNGNLLPILNVHYFAVAEAEQMVLMGSSGGGKTTLLHIIAGISRPDPGPCVVGIDGTNLADNKSESFCDRFRAQKIGYVFQTFNLLPAFTAYENVLLGMTFAHGKHDPTRAKRLLERVGLTHREHHKPTAMSVGEQQRVAVARALANRPRLLLADEPTANIDPKNQQSIIDLIRQTCREENIALVMVTHSPEVANQFQRIDRLENINAASGLVAASK